MSNPDYDLFNRKCQPCKDTTWVPTGDERCRGTDVEREEVSNCGTPRWVVDRAQTWTDTGDTRCVGTNVEKEQENDCKDTRWVVDAPQTWTDTGDTRCVGTNVEKEQENECKATRWVVSGPQVWVPTGDTRCNNHLVEHEEINDCDKTRWVVSTQACGFCASFPVPMDQCDGQQAFGFREGDVRDPLATVEVTDCDGGNKVYFYAAPGPDHSVPVTECDGTLIGYGANTSECASGMPSRIEIGSLPPLKIEKLPDLTIGKLPALTIGELPVVEIKKHLVDSTRVDDEVWTYWSDGTKQVEKLVVPPTPVVYCASYPVPLDQCDSQQAFGFREGDVRDPLATVEITDCEGGGKIYLYPIPGPGRSVPVTECGGRIVGYGANTSNCASGMVERVDIGRLPSLTIGNLPVVEIKRHLVQAVQVGDEVWTYWSDGIKQVEALPVAPAPVVPPPPVVYCPSMRISCDGQPGFGFHEMDPPDPAATVVMAPCPGDESVDPILIYPTAGPGHTVKVLLDGVLKGYAANRSDCAPDCGC